ncbi:hypothetical protein HNP12_000193 [Aeromonas hydrophila]|uniref:hypothetical protein n=1 Tax=Aeromonas hydrophila TaxID=644 RepID=UPI0021670B37|nr:hypothetical protein [Aeromonas hydrophila]MCS3766154.1 hypothetical protein [Aeromonas hydrophila]
MKTPTIPLVMIAIGCLLTGYGLHESNQAQQIEALEQIVQKQHEVICMNSNSLPLQYSEHQVMCTGVVAEVLHRHTN